MCATLVVLVVVGQKIKGGKQNYGLNSNTVHGAPSSFSQQIGWEIDAEGRKKRPTKATAQKCRRKLPLSLARASRLLLGPFRNVDLCLSECGGVGV